MLILHDRVRVINEFRCYEAKIEESEKAGSRWESNLAGFPLFSPHITFISSVRQDALSRVIVATLVDS